MMRHNTIALFAILTLVVSALASLVSWAQPYGGSISAPSGVTFYGTCSNETAGLLFVVGTNTTNHHGVVYRVSSLTSSGLQLFKEYSETSSNFAGAEFYGCSIVYDSINNRNLLVVGGTRYQGGLNNPRAFIIVYDASNPSRYASITTSTSSEKLIIRDIAAIDASIVGGSSGTIYVYFLSVIGTSVVVGTASFTVDNNGGISSGSYSITTITSTGDGYGLTWHPYFGNKIGVLWAGGGKLYLNVYNIGSNGALASPTTIEIVHSWSGARAAEAARINPSAPGWLIAAGDKVYFVDGRSLSLSGSYSISGVGSNTSYAALYSYDGSSGREALYIFASDGSDTYIFAVDLVGGNTAFIDKVASGVVPTGYGDPSLVWVDNSLKIVPKGASGARPYMVYTASGNIIYYDLSRGGLTPFPIPEPWTVGLASLTVALVVLWASRRHRSEGS